MTVSDQLRAALHRCEDSPQKLANTLGIDPLSIRRFSAGGGINSRTTDRLAEHLDLELIPKTTN